MNNNLLYTHVVLLIVVNDDDSMQNSRLLPYHYLMKTMEFGWLEAQLGLKYVQCWAVLTDYFSDPGRAIRQVCVSVHNNYYTKRPSLCTSGTLVHLDTI